MLFFGNLAWCDDYISQRLSLPHDARWGLVVEELKTGRVLLNTGTAPEDQLTPGSLVKLFTAGAVLELQESNGTLDLNTEILYDGKISGGKLLGNIFIEGRGNALLSAEDVKTAAQKIADEGIREITGDVIADETFLDRKGLERTRKGAAYAPPGALGLDLHTVAVTVTPIDSGKPPRVMVMPSNNSVRFAVEGRSVSTHSANMKVTQLDDDAYKVGGNFAIDSGPLKWRFPLKNPALYTAGVLKTSLNEVGITVKGRVGTGKVANGSKVLTTIPGPVINKVVREMNVNSINVVADNLLLLVGAETYGAPGTREKGLRAVDTLLVSLDMPKGEATIVDGSGLREENRVTVRYMAEYLRKISQKSWFKGFSGSLPRAGMDGTLREVGFNDARFRVKSGRLENVFALAGYGVGEKGQDIAFAYIVNTPGPLPASVEKNGAKVMKLISELNSSPRFP